MSKATLPPRDALMRRLRACDDDPQRAEKLFPLICDYLYRGAREKTVEQLGDALINALEWHISEMRKGSRERLQAITVLRNHLGDYLRAITFTFDSAFIEELWAYCDDKQKKKLKP